MNWIDVEERKPPNDHYVLVAIFDYRPKVEMHFLQIASRMNDAWIDDKDGELINMKSRKITHWMPLPDKPEKN